jgi:hypothetical protein
MLQNNFESLLHRLRRTSTETGSNKKTNADSDAVVANFRIPIRKYMLRLGAKASVRRLALRPAKNLFSGASHLK